LNCPFFSVTIKKRKGKEGRKERRRIGKGK
jgi:hypothetical protein